MKYLSIVLFSISSFNFYGQNFENESKHIGAGVVVGGVGGYAAHKIFNGQRGWTWAGAVGSSLAAGLAKETYDKSTAGIWQTDDVLYSTLGGVISGLAMELLFNKSKRSGRWWQGRNIFANNPTAQCVRCHSVDGNGGQVGPALDNIANILTREQILESLIEPSKRLAPGYGSITVTLLDGQVVTGVLEEETEDELILRTNDAEPMEIAQSRIKKRENRISAMPPMGRMISRRELRDLMEYLGSLKETDG